MAKKDILVERGNRLQNIRQKAGLTRLEFAHKTGISANTLKSLELGDREITPQKALLFSNLFSSLFAVSLGEDAYEASFDYLFYGKIKESPKVDLSKHSADDLLQKDINSFAMNSSYLMLTISDNLMSPFYNEGDIVCGLKISNKSQFSDYEGQICILLSLSGEKCLRRIIKTDNHKITAYVLNTNITQAANLVEDIEVVCMAQAIRHWHLSDMVQAPSTF